MKTIVGDYPSRADPLASLVSDKMDHEGVLHGLPADPILTRANAGPNELGVSRHNAASIVVDRYVSVAMKKVKEELRGEIEQNGIGILREFMKEHPQETPETGTQTGSGVQLYLSLYGHF